MVVLSQSAPGHGGHFEELHVPSQGFREAISQFGTVNEIGSE